MGCKGGEIARLASLAHSSTCDGAPSRTGSRISHFMDWQVASDVRILLDSSLGSAAPDASDVRLAQGGDSCAQCNQGSLSQVKGIEVGHCFVLGGCACSHQSVDHS